MKRVLVTSVAFLCLLSGSAVAADMGMPLKAPAPTYSWTGLYVAGGGGYGLWSADTTTVDPVTGVCVLCLTQTQGGSGWFGRVGAGFDYQFSVPIGSWTPQLVIGPMADFDFSSLKGTIQDQGPFFAGTIKEDWSWAAGARAGLITFRDILTYINGGFAQTHFAGAAMQDTFTGITTPFATPAFTANGWFLGGGVETPLSFILPVGWFIRTEYRYAYYGTSTLTDSAPGGSPVTAPGVGTFGNPQNSITFKPTVQTISTEISYKFNWTP